MCQHHWLIPEADGPISKGVCKYCGEERGFSNWVDMVVKDGTSGTRYAERRFVQPEHGMRRSIDWE